MSVLTGLAVSRLALQEWQIVTSVSSQDWHSVQTGLQDWQIVMAVSLHDWHSVKTVR